MTHQIIASLPHALSPPTIAIFPDAREAEDALRFAMHQRPFWSHQLRAVRPRTGAETPEHTASQPALTPTQRALLSAWRSESWPCSYRSAWVVIDALFDELVWSFEEHPKGGHPFSIDQPIADYLAGDDPFVETPDDLPAIASARPRVTDALITHRRPDVERCPAAAASRGDLPRLRALLDGGASLEQRDPARRTPLAAALSGGRDGVLGRGGSRDEAPQERVVLELMARGASVPAALEVVEPDRRAHAPTALLLDIAMRRRWYVLTEHLLSRGAPADEAVPVRPIELLFLMGGPVELFDRLRERGAHIDATSPIWTPGLLTRLERMSPPLHRIAEGLIRA